MAGKLSFGFATIGVLWCAALVVYLPQTFISDDEPMLAVIIPVLLAGGVFVALHRTCHGHRGRSAAWTLAALLYAYSVITGFSIGMFVMPAAAAMLAAAATVPSPR
jgi:hypothetical protein